MGWYPEVVPMYDGTGQVIQPPNGKSWTSITHGWDIRIDALRARIEEIGRVFGLNIWYDLDHPLYSWSRGAGSVKRLLSLPAGYDDGLYVSHITDLRQLVNAIEDYKGVSRSSWTTPTLQPKWIGSVRQLSFTVANKAVYLNEIAAALDRLYRSPADVLTYVAFVPRSISTLDNIDGDLGGTFGIVSPEAANQSITSTKHLTNWNDVNDPVFNVNDTFFPLGHPFNGHPIEFSWVDDPDAPSFGDMTPTGKRDYGWQFGAVGARPCMPGRFDVDFVDSYNLLPWNFSSIGQVWDQVALRLKFNGVGFFILSEGVGLGRLSGDTWTQYWQTGNGEINQKHLVWGASSVTSPSTHVKVGVYDGTIDRSFIPGNKVAFPLDTARWSWGTWKYREVNLSGKAAYEDLTAADNKDYTIIIRDNPPPDWTFPYRWWRFGVFRVK